MVTVYGNPRSTATRMVLMTLAETDTPYELAVIDIPKREHKTEAHLARQPFGRIPAIDDDGFVMYESRAICRYLAARGPSSLLPREPKGHARMEQWMSVETWEFSPHAMKFIHEHVFKHPQEPAALEAAGKALATTCAVLDARLGDAEFLAGDTFSLADVCYMPYLEYASATPAADIFAKHARLSAWWERLSARPAWKRAIGKA